MSESLSNEQLAAHVNNPDNYGASVGFHDRKMSKGKGFMTAFDGAEKPTPLPIKAADIADYRQAHHELASSHAGAIHGIWKNPKTEGMADQDLSVKLDSPKATQEMGVAEKQKASYGQPHTRVSSRGHNMGKEGGDILLHTADLGKNDVDPRYQPGALDMRGGKGSFTRNQYVNKDMKKTGGTLKGEPVSYESVLRTINENRVARMRGE
jgi:hypothetical protein